MEPIEVSHQQVVKNEDAKMSKYLKTIVLLINCAMLGIGNCGSLLVLKAYSSTVGNEFGSQAAATRVIAAARGTLHQDHLRGYSLVELSTPLNSRPKKGQPKTLDFKVFFVENSGKKSRVQATVQRALEMSFRYITVFAYLSRQPKPDVGLN
ncbi:hypothetical protein NE237_024052 [Protea cynaroides]|uniref:Uncharacterized protein n=1 Tax=Protea cynaroides TaxID=273540 RepID=A0A9Q0K6W4_9MAGN|nr:hypothetical protein NE237_024052 [Protea cynaroides]